MPAPKAVPMALPKALSARMRRRCQGQIRNRWQIATAKVQAGKKLLRDRAKALKAEIKRYRGARALLTLAEHDAMALELLLD